MSIKLMVLFWIIFRIIMDSIVAETASVPSVASNALLLTSSPIMLTSFSFLINLQLFHLGNFFTWRRFSIRVNVFKIAIFLFSFVFFLILITHLRPHSLLSLLNRLGCLCIVSILRTLSRFEFFVIFLIN